MAQLENSVKSTTTELADTLDTASFVLQDAREYFTNLTTYLKNVTIITSRRRSSDLLPLDSCSGVLWTVVIPVTYFLIVVVVLCFLFLFFWYKNMSIATSQSCDSAAQAYAAGVRHDTAVEGEGNVSLVQDSRAWSCLNDNNGEGRAVSQNSDSSKASMRSLGVLTTKDLDVASNFAASTENRCVATGINNRESPHEAQCASSWRFCHAPHVDTPGGSRVLEVVRSVDAKMADTAGLRVSGSSSFSSDSLDTVMTRDSLRASTESHLHACAAAGEIGPEDLYENKTVAPATRNIGVTIDINENPAPNSAIVFNNLDFRTELPYFKDMKKTCESASSGYTKANMRTQDSVPRISCRFKSLAEVQNSSCSSPYPRRPGRELFELPHSESTSNKRSSASKLNLHLPVKKSLKEATRTRRPVIADAGTSVHEEHSDGRRIIQNPSQASREPPRQTSFFRFHGEYFHAFPTINSFDSLEEVDCEASHSATSVQYQEKDNMLDMGLIGFNTSPVSQMNVILSEELADSQNNSVISADTRNDGSPPYSPTSSLPSSIVRFHASKAELPSAAYPLHKPESVMLNVTAESSNHAEENRGYSSLCDSQIDGASLYANKGSDSQSTETLNTALLSSGSSFELSEFVVSFEKDDDESSVRPIHKSLKFLKKASPLSGLVHNFRQRYSLDDSFLKRAREASEEEALIRSPLIKSEPGINHTRLQHSDFFKREPVTVEERLREFGFIKGNRKNMYFVNPTPGKFESRSGFTNSEPRCNKDTRMNKEYLTGNDNHQHRSPRLPISRFEVSNSSSTQSEEDNSRSGIFQVLDGKINFFRGPAIPDNFINCLQGPHLENKGQQRGKTASNEKCEKHTVPHDEDPFFSGTSQNQTGNQARQGDVETIHEDQGFDLSVEPNHSGRQVAGAFRLCGRDFRKRHLNVRDSSVLAQAEPTHNASFKRRIQGTWVEETSLMKEENVDLDNITNADAGRGSDSGYTGAKKVVERTKIPVRSDMKTVRTTGLTLQRQRTSRSIGLSENNCSNGFIPTYKG